MPAVEDVSKPFVVFPKLVCTLESPGQLKNIDTDAYVPSLKVLISGGVLPLGVLKKIPGRILMCRREKKGKAW